MVFIEVNYRATAISASSVSILTGIATEVTPYVSTKYHPMGNGTTLNAFGGSARVLTNGEVQAGHAAAGAIVNLTPTPASGSISTR